MWTQACSVLVHEAMRETSLQKWWMAVTSAKRVVENHKMGLHEPGLGLRLVVREVREWRRKALKKGTTCTM